MILDIRNLRLSFKTIGSTVDVLHGIDLSIAPGQKVAPVSYTHLTLPTILLV